MDIVDYAKSKGIQIKKSGSYYKIKCIFPEHKDNDPSMVLYPDTNSFYCFGCGRFGDLVDFAAVFGDKLLRDKKEIDKIKRYKADREAIIKDLVTKFNRYRKDRKTLGHNKVNIIVLQELYKL